MYYCADLADNFCLGLLEFNKRQQVIQLVKRTHDFLLVFLNDNYVIIHRRIDTRRFHFMDKILYNTGNGCYHIACFGIEQNIKNVWQGKNRGKKQIDIRVENYT